MSGTLAVDFAGEVHHLQPGDRLTVGRSGTIAIDDNPFLHREFLSFEHSQEYWWVENVGSLLAAKVADAGRTMRGTLSPGAHMPIVFPRAIVTFSAGDTLYELRLQLETTSFEMVHNDRATNASGEATVGPGSFTTSQLMCIVALAEPFLRNPGVGFGEVPSAQEAAQRLGWGQSKFTRKLDNVCDRLAAAGVSGLQAGKSGAAQNRRINLVEFAVSTLLVTVEHLPLLDLARPTEDDS